MSIVAKPIQRGSRQLLLLCIYLSLSMWTTFAMYSLQIYKYSKDCPQYSDLLILYDTELDANIIVSLSLYLRLSEFEQSIIYCRIFIVPIRLLTTHLQMQ